MSEKRGFSDHWNFWAVCCLRQSLNNHSVATILGILLLLQFLMLIRIWTIGRVTLLLVIMLGAYRCISGTFGLRPFFSKGDGPLVHLRGFSPLDPLLLIRGILISYSLFFAAFWGVTVFSWLALAVTFSPQDGTLVRALLLPIVNAYFLPLTAFFLVNGGKFRLETLILAFGAIWLWIGRGPGWQPLEPWLLFLTSAWIAIYAALLFWQRLLPAVRDGEPVLRLFQLLTLLLFAGILALLPEAQISGNQLIALPLLTVAAGAATGCLPEARRAAAQRERLPVGFGRRLQSFLLARRSMGGWFWCAGCSIAVFLILRKYEIEALWQFSIPVMVVTAELGVLFRLLLYRLGRGPSWQPEHYLLGGTFLLLAVIYLVYGLLQLQNAVLAAVLAPAVWGTAAVLFAPLLPYFAADLRKFFFQGGSEA